MVRLTSRDRVLATVKRASSDRVPVGSMGFADGIARDIRRLLGAPEGVDLRALLGIDMLGIAPAYIGPDLEFKPENRRRSFFGSSHKSYADGIIERPLRYASTIEEIEHFRWPTVDDYDFSEVEDRYANGSELALYGPGWTPTFSQLCELFGIQTTLINLITQPALVEAAVTRITELVVDMITGLHAATHGNMPIMKTADDYATQRGMMFSPALWRRFFRPGLARQFRAAKELGMVTMMHACGDVSEILPDLVDIGLDILEPTQAHLPGMRPGKLKRAFGAHLTFFGAICTQSTLPFGTPGDVRQEVADRIRVLGDGGGYIVSPDHQVLDDVPAENVIALYESAGSLAE